MKWELHLPIELESANVQIARTRAIGSARRAGGITKARRESYARTIVFVARGARVPLMAGALSVPTFRRVTVVRLIPKRGRAWDSDSLPFAAKTLRDACQASKGAGLVWDDSAKWSAWTYEQRKSDDGKPGVLLIVEEG